MAAARSTVATSGSAAIAAASSPARTGAANDVPLHVQKPLRKSSGSGVVRTRPWNSTLALGCAAAVTSSGKVLTSELPGRWVVTHDPALEK